MKMAKMLIAMIISCSTFSVQAQMSVAERGLHVLGAAASFSAAGICAKLYGAGVIMSKNTPAMSTNAKIPSEAHNHVLRILSENNRTGIAILGGVCVLSGLHQLYSAVRGFPESDSRK